MYNTRSKTRVMDLGETFRSLKSEAEVLGLTGADLVAYVERGKEKEENTRREREGREENARREKEEREENARREEREENARREREEREERTEREEREERERQAEREFELRRIQI